MNKEFAHHLNWRDGVASVRRHWRLLVVIGAIAAIIILATHIDLRQALVNPAVLFIGGIMIAVHLFGGVVVTLVMAIMRRRWRR